ncbi:MAG: fructosamine kinase family protein [Gammaproteobacteria bacterium]|nr:MAG: fructosamine kinase family protein [Gammaproteobacteria bacterium]
MFNQTIDWETIAKHISETSGLPFQIKRQQEVGGGCINKTYQVSDNDNQSYFVKLNNAQYQDMFAAEADGLSELEKAAVVKVPKPLCFGTAGHQAYLVMEYLKFDIKDHSAISELGQQLANLHQKTAPLFGLHRDNYIGSTRQVNTLEKDWSTFWQKHRLHFQLKLAARNGYNGKNLQTQGERLIAELSQFFTDYQPQPSLLHGDLWSGNYAVAIQGSHPVIYDPAVYYGDRETDIAMTELFGAFPKRFYEAYQDSWALDVGYSTRKVLYNLYHILNHLNLFGGGYLRQAENMIASLLSELG